MTMDDCAEQVYRELRRKFTIEDATTIIGMMRALNARDTETSINPTKDLHPHSYHSGG